MLLVQKLDEIEMFDVYFAYSLTIAFIFSRTYIHLFSFSVNKLINNLLDFIHRRGDDKTCRSPPFSLCSHHLVLYKGW